MGTITSVRRNVKNGGRCSVFVDGEFLVACPIDVAVSLELHKGLEMTYQLERTLRGEDRRMVLKQKTYHFATYKPRTEKQVRTYLVGREATPEEIDFVVSWLRDFRLIDDRNYAEQFIEAAKERKPLSRLMARRMLVAKGVPEEIVDNVLEVRYGPDDALDAARRVATKKLRSLSTETEKKRVEKLVRFLQYRGYPWDVIRKVIGELHLTSSVILILTWMIVLSQTPLAVMAQAITNCNRARLPETINRFQTTTQPVLAPDGILFLDRKLHPNNADGGVHDPDDVWSSHRDSFGVWSEVSRETFTTILRPDVVFTVTSDGLEALVVGRYRDGKDEESTCMAIISRPSQGELFDRVHPLVIPRLSSLGRNFYASMSDDRQHIIVAVDQSQGVGGLDLYHTFRCNDSWSPLTSLGPFINTPAFDGAPWLAHDNITLYFASSGREDRYGKADLYVTRRLSDDWTKWSVPVNLGTCFNSVEDETAFSLNGSGDSAFIYSWDAETSRSGIYIVGIPQDISPVPWCSFTGKVVNAVTREAVDGITFLVQDSASHCASALIPIDTRTHSFRVSLASQRRYFVTTEAKNFVSHRQSIGIRNLDSVTDLRVTIGMFDKRVPLASIFFDRGVAQLNEENLRLLVQLVERYDIRQIAFDVVGYTDFVGSKSLNATLSQNRAEAVSTELVRLGLFQDRIRSIGRGIEHPGTLLGLVENPQSRRVDIFPADQSGR